MRTSKEYVQPFPSPHTIASCDSQVKNEVVIWDRIVRRKEDAQLSVAGRNKYAFRELSASFKCVLCLFTRFPPCYVREKEITKTKLHLFRDAPPAHYSLKYNIMPYVGVLTYGEAARTVEPVPFPARQDLS